MIPIDTMPAPPIAKITPVTAVLHEDTRIDNYFWLRDKTNSETIDYLTAENRHTEVLMEPTEPLREQLYQEILGRVKETDQSAPERRGRYFYYTRTGKGKQYAIYCRKRESLDAAEEVLIDPNALALGQKYFRIGGFEPSPDHQLLAYSTDVEGDEVYTVRVKDLRTGELLPDSIPGASAALQWANDNRTLFYTKVDAAKRPFQVFRHHLGASQDALVFHEVDERFTVKLSKTKDQVYLFLELDSHTTSEYSCLRADDPEGDPRVLLPRRQDVEYEVVHHDGHFYIRINDTGKNFRLVKVPAADPVMSNAIELRPSRQDVMLEGLDAFHSHLVLMERENGLRRLLVEAWNTGQRHAITFREPVYTVWLAGNPEYETGTLRFSYTSLVTPLSVFDYDMETRTRELVKQTEVLGGHDPAQYTSERLFATANDGTKVPISVVYKIGWRRVGRAPLLLYGYGAYGLNSEPSFSSERLSLLDRGYAYAIAHVRGGSEMGRPWYDDGKMMRKKNTFTDFIACAEHLIAEQYTSSARLAISGGSAGGLLMGAVVNMRPDLFHTVIAKVPFVDVVSTMLDPTLPLTITEYEEWGNPNERTAYEYIRSYSPYDNVDAKAYPNMLITAGLNDPRVSYWEPAKWAAKLRATKTGSGLLLLKTNMGAGHFGASGRYEKFKETAFDYAFLLTVLGESD